MEVDEARYRVSICVPAIFTVVKGRMTPYSCVASFRVMQVPQGGFHRNDPPLFRVCTPPSYPPLSSQDCVHTLFFYPSSLLFPLFSVFCFLANGSSPS